MNAFEKAIRAGKWKPSRESSASVPKKIADLLAWGARHFRGEFLGVEQIYRAVVGVRRSKLSTEELRAWKSRGSSVRENLMKCFNHTLITHRTLGWRASFNDNDKLTEGLERSRLRVRSAYISAQKEADIIKFKNLTVNNKSRFTEILEGLKSVHASLLAPKDLEESPHEVAS